MRQLRNYTEEAVEMYVERWFKEADICQCASCRLDVKAIMLNNLSPQYIVTDQGALYAQMTDFDPQFKADLTTAMGLAIKLVNSRPRHDREREEDQAAQQVQAAQNENELSLQDQEPQA